MICHTQGAAEQQAHLLASHSKMQKGFWHSAITTSELTLLCRSHVPDPPLALRPKAKQFNTGFGLVFFFLTGVITPVLHLLLIHGKTKVSFFPVSFQYLNLPPFSIPLFPPSICLRDGATKREHTLFTLCTPKPIFTVNRVFFGGEGVENNAHAKPLKQTNVLSSSYLALWIVPLLCKFITGH